MKRILRLKTIGVVLLAVMVLAGWMAEAEAREKPSRVKHIIVFVGDGMHLEHEIAASRYLYGKDDALSFQGLAYKGFMATWDTTTYNKYAASLGMPSYDPTNFNPQLGYDTSKGGKKPYPLQSSGFDESYFLTKLAGKIPATDSASAATTWATGHKTDDGNIAWKPGDPADGALTTLAELLRLQKGYAIGVVSTVPFTHATPAAFVSHNVSRNDYIRIASEIVRTIQPEVVIGGGYPGSKGTNSFNYLSEADYNFLKGSDPSNPYRYVERQDGADGAISLRQAAKEASMSGKKLFGLFGGPSGNFESPIAHDFPEMPIVTRATIENPTLEDAALAAIQVLSQDPDGFFVMIEQGDIDWANHSNDFKRMVGTTWDLHVAVQGVIDYINRPDDEIDWTNTLLIVTSDHSNSYMRLIEVLRPGDLPNQVATGSSFSYPDGEVRYSTGDHTNELVMLYAQGGLAAVDLKRYEGKWYPCTRIIDNTQLYHFMAEAAGAPQTSALSPKIDRKAACGR